MSNGSTFKGDFAFKAVFQPESNPVAPSAAELLAPGVKGGLLLQERKLGLGGLRQSSHTKYPIAKGCCLAQAFIAHTPPISPTS